MPLCFTTFLWCREGPREFPLPTHPRSTSSCSRSCPPACFCLDELQHYHHNESLPRPPTLVYAAAFTAFATLFLTSNLCCFLNLKTLNLSKSVNSRLLELLALLLAHALSAHLLSTLAASHCFLMAPVPAARGILGMTM